VFRQADYVRVCWTTRLKSSGSKLLSKRMEKKECKLQKVKERKWKEEKIMKWIKIDNKNQQS
jgi:hypothetical protein